MKCWIPMERRPPSVGALSCLAVLLLVLCAASTSASPIMVPSGKIGPIVPPTPRPRRIVQYPLREPPPVHEYPDPALEEPEFTGEYNSIVEPIGTYKGYPKRFGQQLRNPPPPPVGVLMPRTIAALSGRNNQIAYKLSLKYPQYKLLI